MVQEINRATARIQDYLRAQVFAGCECAVIEGAASARYQLGQAAILPQAEPLSAATLAPSGQVRSELRRDRDRLWDLASVSKVVGVGTAVINRVLAGELTLETPLSALDAAWPDQTVTLRQLLTHTTGIDPAIKNRDAMDARQLTEALYHLSVSPDKTFHYTDVNFILLGFMLEKLEHRPLAEILQAEIFEPWQMPATGYGPVLPPDRAVPTAYQLPRGVVHDPKARVLGAHCGSAGLFSTARDLTAFVQGYFADEKYLQLLKNYSLSPGKPRSLAWDLLPGGWLAHTGYTGTFILMQLERQQAIVFLSNRVHLKDERAEWIRQRDLLMADFMQDLTDF